MTREESISNHPAGKALEPTSETNPLMVPARYITSGDHFWGFSVFSIKYERYWTGISLCIPGTTHTQTINIKRADLDAIIYPVTKRGDSYSPKARNTNLGQPLEKDAPAPYVAPEPVAVYPVGTRIGDVKHFDRGQKVVFHCPKHPARHWASKDPFSSSWFDAGKEFGDLEECDCNTSDYVVKFEYKPTRNG